MKSLAVKTSMQGPQPGQSKKVSRPVTALQMLSDEALLTRLFALNLPRPEARLQASRWLKRHQGFRELVSPSVSPPGTDIATHTEWTRDHWRCLLEICGEIFTRSLAEKLHRGIPLTSPAETLDFLQSLLQNRRREVFYGVFLDTRHRVIRHEALFQGSIDGACVYPRVVAEHALRHNAAAVIVAHNHPSGVSEPSLADQAITRRLKDALSLLEIRLLDHFIIGDGAPVSLASRGMI